MADQFSATQSVQDHILVCLSSSVTNAKIIRTAAKMAEAFNGVFTALYVQTPAFDKMSEEDRNRLKNHMELAERLGADVTVMYGEDVPFQIAEYARISGVSKIVLGRSNASRRHFWSQPTLTEHLIEIVPNIDIHIIPDSAMDSSYRVKSAKSIAIMPTWSDLMTTMLILAAATGVGNLFMYLSFTEANIITVYIFGVLGISLLTKGYACSFIGSLASVLLFNFFFTEPRLTFHAYETGYPVTFAIMLIVSLLTGTLAARQKAHARQVSQAAYRTKVLFDTNQMLQKAKTETETFDITASQLLKLLGRDIVIYPQKDNSLERGYLFSHDRDSESMFFFSVKEKQVADWVLQNKKRAGATTDMFSDAKCLYLAIRINGKVFGVVGIFIGDKPLDFLENSILLSILGECALAIESMRNALEKEKTAILAENERLRANLLRSISHDLRTPLTSISGNADNLMQNSDKLDSDTKNSIYADIYDDSMWLISIVENLLSVTRMEGGDMNLNMSVQLVDEVIAEAMTHIHYPKSRHQLCVDCGNELMFAKMDAKLIMQVIINLVDNAIKHTPEGSDISVAAKSENDHIFISVSDSGKGIDDSQKEKIFEMFYTGASKVADSRRSLGLGLALCRSIARAHGGDILLTDNQPTGSVFTLVLPAEKVNLHE